MPLTLPLNPRTRLSATFRMALKPGSCHSELVEESMLLILTLTLILSIKKPPSSPRESGGPKIPAIAKD